MLRKQPGDLGNDGFKSRKVDDVATGGDMTASSFRSLERKGRVPWLGFPSSNAGTLGGFSLEIRKHTCRPLNPAMKEAELLAGMVDAGA